ncbi:hypothetical protein LCGC14_2084530 [marine sediment metagenome]|uniref:Uncharacterized protein n=1 Tax=marine sediment metagenome TaxID=412755 RepID=A0A0F9EEG3_9ZZZZ
MKPLLTMTVTIAQDVLGLYVEGSVGDNPTVIRVPDEASAKMAAAKLLASWAQWLAGEAAIDSNDKPKVILQ